ncbi:MAG: ROK family protein [Candidatus Sungbacteria bacterium]|uniref:ROK family protein n=1 Tax=Candidatus Sungiibacteriota bacterium TaxID=2750080 RepID=A0A931SBG5_9BACT|nr:ROK family protein [Candidatus Sungbacteria bacterium]
MSKYYLGVDIGGTKIRIVRLEGLEKQACRPKIFPTPRNLIELSAALKPFYQNKDLAGIGVSVAGSVLPNSSRVSSAANLSFLNGVGVSDLFPKTAVDMRLDNDARCFLRAELAWRKMVEKNNVVGIVFGTGIGAAIWKNGEFIVGEDGLAAEFGHSIHLDGLEWEELARMEFQEKGTAVDAYARGIAKVIERLHPSFIVLGGGPIAAGNYDIVDLKNRILDFLKHDSFPEIEFGSLGDAAQAIGAALLFAD